MLWHLAADHNVARRPTDLERQVSDSVAVAHHVAKDMVIWPRKVGFLLVEVFGKVHTPIARAGGGVTKSNSTPRAARTGSISRSGAGLRPSAAGVWVVRWVDNSGWWRGMRRLVAKLHSALVFVDHIVAAFDEEMVVTR